MSVRSHAVPSSIGGPVAGDGSESSVERQVDMRGTEKVAISALVPADSPRTGGEDGEHVRVLAELGGELPPIVVQRSSMRVVDGMHRLRAAVLRGADMIDVHFFDGADEDAFVLAVKLNGAHGLPLSAVERRSAAERILASHPEWSDVGIASVAGVSDKTVASMRQRSTSDSSGLNFRVGRDGRRRPVNGAGGRLRAGEFIAKRPDASLREIAADAGIALATARDVRARVRRGDHPVPGRQRAGASLELLHSGVGVRRDPVFESPGLRTLVRDPALRANEECRALLRVLSITMLGDGRWGRVIDSIPSHCVPTVAEVARECATAWNRFASSLEANETRDRKGPV